MWNEPMPKWRTAQKQHQCEGDGCAKVIAPRRALSRQALRQPHIAISDTVRSAPSPSSGGPTGITSSTVAMIFLIAIINAFPMGNGRALKRKVIEKRGNRCQRCEQEIASLHLHHVHYRSFGSERPEDVELLCTECHTRADEARAAERRRNTKSPKKAGLSVLMVGSLE